MVLLSNHLSKLNKISPQITVSFSFLLTLYFLCRQSLYTSLTVSHLAFCMTIALPIILFMFVPLGLTAT